MKKPVKRRGFADGGKVTGNDDMRGHAFSGEPLMGRKKSYQLDPEVEGKPGPSRGDMGYDSPPKPRDEPAKSPPKPGGRFGMENKFSPKAAPAFAKGGKVAKARGKGR